MKNFIFNLLADLHVRLRYCAGYHEHAMGNRVLNDAMMKASMSIPMFWTEHTDHDGYTYSHFRVPRWDWGPVEELREQEKRERCASGP